MISSRGKTDPALAELLSLREKAVRSGGQAAGMPAEEDEAELSPTAPLAPEEKKAPATGFILVHMASNTGFAVPPSGLLCGSSSACDLVIEEPQISRNHCYITIKRDRLFLKDLSKNGCSVGALGAGEADLLRLPKDTEVEIKPGRVISLAGVRFLLIRGEEVQ